MLVMWMVVVFLVDWKEVVRVKVVGWWEEAAQKLVFQAVTSPPREPFAGTIWNASQWWGRKD